MTRPGTVTTFYSFKGGVGRTFILANVAWLLASWGRRVLCIDWDIEAPGLHRYLSRGNEPRRGLLDLLSTLGTRQKLDWRDLVEDIPVVGDRSIHLLRAGRLDDAYVEALQAVNWDRWWKKGLGNWLEELRAQWVAEYDHVFIDSRTGLTDIGGICAAQLPDFLAIVFTASHQSLDGALDVARRAAAARGRLPVDRPGFLTIPIPSRFDAREEYELGREWQQRFAAALHETFDAWRPLSLSVEAMISLLRVPYLTVWSFGERLPASMEQVGDPELISYWFANIAALIDQRLGDPTTLVERRPEYLRRAGAENHVATAIHFRWDVFISHGYPDTPAAEGLARALGEQGLRVFVDTLSLRPGENIDHALNVALRSARAIVILLSSTTGMRTHHELEIEAVAGLARTQGILVIPVFLDTGAAEVAPGWLRRLYGLHNRGDWGELATRIRRAL